MKIAVQTLAQSASLELDMSDAGQRTQLHVVLGGGCGSMLRANAPIAGVWIALRGRLQLGGATETVVHAGEICTSEADSRLCAIGRGNALWIAVLGTPAAWRHRLHVQRGMPSTESALLPMRQFAGRALRRSAAILGRAVLANDADAATEAVLDRAIELQRCFADVIARCPGRTYAQRRMVFLRLQRVRNYITENSHLDLDNEELAHMASYSPWHFIRAFRAAYQETPHAYLVRTRLERAHQMLRTGPLAVAEVAVESGFENRCAFSRMFRQRFGTTAAAIRRAASAGVAIPVSALR